MRVPLHRFQCKSQCSSCSITNVCCSPQTTFRGDEKVAVAKLLQTTWQLSKACQNGRASMCYRLEEDRVVEDVKTTEKAATEIGRLFAVGHEELDVVIQTVADVPDQLAKQYEYIVEAQTRVGKK